MKLKLDENLSRHLKPTLSFLEHDVLTAADEGLLSQSDVAVARASMAEGTMLFTMDLEFDDPQKHPLGHHQGIVVFCPRSLGPLSVNRLVEEFIRETNLGELEGWVVLVEPNRVRVRRPPLDTSGKEWEEVSI